MTASTLRSGPELIVKNTGRWNKGMIRKIVSIALLLAINLLLVSYDKSEQQFSEAYGVVIRILPKQGRAVLFPVGGELTPRAEIKFYDDNGIYCVSGIVLSSYSDIAYVKVEEKDIGKLKRGFQAAIEGKEEYITFLSEYGLNLVWLMNSGYESGHLLPPNDISLDYLKRNASEVIFHHYLHKYSCDTCHHSHHKATDTPCRSCHLSETAKKYIARDISSFDELVKIKCLECHKGNHLASR